MGVPCLTAAPEQVQALQTLLEDQPTTELTLDLQALTLTAGDQVIPLTMAESTRQMLLSGQWDACGQLLANQDKIHDVAARLPYVRWAVS